MILIVNYKRYIGKSQFLYPKNLERFLIVVKLILFSYHYSFLLLIFLQSMYMYLKISSAGVFFLLCAFFTYINYFLLIVTDTIITLK